MSSPSLMLLNCKHYLITPPTSPSRYDGSDQVESQAIPHSSAGDRTIYDQPLSPFDSSTSSPDLPMFRKASFGMLTKPSFRSRPSLSSSSSFRRRPALETSWTGSSSRSNSFIRSPDRFLSTRDSSNAFIHKFRTSKDPRHLSSTEKLLRQETDSADVFSPRRRVTSPSHPIGVQASRRGSAGMRAGGPSTLAFRRDLTPTSSERRVSLGSAWAVGGLAPVSIGISNGRGGLIGSGTNAPLYTTSFSSVVPKAEEELEIHEGRLAKALNLDRTQRVLDFGRLSTSPNKLLVGKRKYAGTEKKSVWTGTEWIIDGKYTILDAPNLRDDFYCSVLAYSPTCHTLAVGLGDLLYAWSEAQGVHLLNAGSSNGSWLTSIAFSSTQGCKCILAYGRSDGTLRLMSPYDQGLPRFEVQQPCPIACVSWRPTVTLRPSRNPTMLGMLINTEDLIVGDEIGNVYYYSVEWPDVWEVDRNGWTGVMTLLARISIHSQQICGLAWSHSGALFATGGNDNLCCLFNVSQIMQSQLNNTDTDEEVLIGTDDIRRTHAIVGRSGVKAILSGAEKHRWIHGAAVKAIAFCPWRDGLLATGGGSNDKCIHFFHAASGACLATISVAAQVTSLIWSTTRREIAATFGYAQPEHPYRIAVFSWPECRQVAAIPWEGEHRALYAISYPGGPNESHSSREGVGSMSRTAQEGCIVVAASDESVKFHEVWTAGQKATAGGEGLLGGSDILEGLEGIDKEGDVIR